MAGLSRPVAVRIEGDSMTPTFRSGDVVIVEANPAALHPLRDGIYVLSIGQGPVIKRLAFLPDHQIKIISDNPVYDAHTMDLASDDVVLHGRVVKVWKAA